MRTLRGPFTLRSCGQFAPLGPELMERLRQKIFYVGDLTVAGVEF
jgi:hypothetical protein